MFLIALLLFMAHTTFAQTIYEKLDARIVKTDSLVCVGLDPDITKMPLSILQNEQNSEEKVYTFLTEIIDITAPHACAYKLQKAFYDLFDNGHELLRNVIDYIHTHYSDIPVFVDCKIGDTDNTMLAYMSLLFDNMKADAIVINPYMGDDVLEPFMKDKNKSAIVLIQTSNPKAKIIQEIITKSGKQLWQEVLNLTLNRWNIQNNLILVLSSNTDESHYESIREQIPQDVPILLAGIGLQGGNPSVLKKLLNNNNRGVFVNSSRGILYPYSQHETEWQITVLNATVELKNMLNSIRNN